MENSARVSATLKEDFAADGLSWCILSICHNVGRPHAIAAPSKDVVAIKEEIQKLLREPLAPLQEDYWLSCFILPCTLALLLRVRYCIKYL